MYSIDVYLDISEKCFNDRERIYAGEFDERVANANAVR